MDMPSPSASSDKSLEEALCQCVEELAKKKLTISCARGPATEPVSMFFTFENPKRGNEASPGLNHERGFKSITPRGSYEKMGPRPGPIAKLPRQHRQTSKGPMKLYPADASNFKELVYEHTSQYASSSMPDVAAQPTSPLTPHSASNSSTRGLMSQPSSPTTPHSIQSSSASPLSSPHDGHPYVNPFQLSFSTHAEYRPFQNTHLDVPYNHPLQISTLSHNTNLHQSTFVPRCASTPCLGISSEAENVPSDDGRPHGMSPELYARKLSLERFLFG